MTDGERAKIKEKADLKAKAFFDSRRKKRAEKQPQDLPTKKQKPTICPIHHKRFDEHWTPSRGTYYTCPICGRNPEEALRIDSLNGKEKDETLEQRLERLAHDLAKTEEIDYKDAFEKIMKTSDGLRYQQYQKEAARKKAQGNPFWG